LEECDGDGEVNRVPQSAPIAPNLELAIAPTRMPDQLCQPHIDGRAIVQTKRREEFADASLHQAQSRSRVVGAEVWFSPARARLL